MQKHRKKVDRQKQFVNYDKAQNVLLLFESDYTEKNLEVKKVIQAMTEDGKNVTAWGYVNKKEIMTPTYPNYKILHSKDFSFWKKPKEVVIKDLLAQEYDLLIDITKETLLPVDYLVLYAHAKCKTGIFKRGINLYDFSIDLNSFLSERDINIEDLDHSFLFDQIIFYLKSIQTKD